MKKLSIVIMLLLLLPACSSGVGSPAYRVTPTRPPATFTPDPSLKVVKIGEGPCVGVTSPEDAKTSLPGKDKTWSSPPEMTINRDNTYCAILTTEKGRMVLQLYPKIAPQHVNSFVFLARQNFYDDTTFHRVLTDFMAQGGDPTGTGSGGPGYALPLETSSAALYDRVGVLGAARTTEPNTAGSQFFITFGPTPSLNPGANGAGYTIFGQLVEGEATLRAITLRDPQTNPTFSGDRLISVRIVELPAQ